MAISVGVIGLGALGEPIAGRLLQAGFATGVCDVRRDPVERLAKLGGRLLVSGCEWTISLNIASAVASWPLRAR